MQKYHDDLTRIGVSNVSRETLEGLKYYEEQLQKWTKKINLISQNTQHDIWCRHILDSIQIIPHIPTEINIWADFGSGAGLPGLVAGYVSKGNWQKQVYVESDQRKSTFLRKMSRDLGMNVDVIDARIEKIPPLKADLITARALATLSDLNSYTQNHLNKTGLSVFLKGRTWQKEVSEARESWDFDVNIISSITDAEARILIVKNLTGKKNEQCA